MAPASDIAVAIGFLILFFAAGIVIIRAAIRRPVEVRVQQEPPPEAEDAPRCVCGEPATERSPTLERGRASVIRDLFAFPPTYRRVVRDTGPLAYCKAHAGTADAEAGAFASSEIRAELTRAYAKVAARVAAFETEELPRRVSASLTDDQRKRPRRPSAPMLRALPRNGTEDA